MREKKSDKNQSELLAAAEAILFTMGKSVELSKMAEALGLSEAQTKALIEKLKEKFPYLDLQNEISLCQTRLKK